MKTAADILFRTVSPQLLVSNIDTSLDFYRTILGFRIDFRYENFYVGIIKDACSIHLKLADSPTDEREFRRANAHLDLTIIVDELDEMYRLISKNEVEVTQALREMEYGREFYIADPDGYILAFMEDA